MIKKIMEGKIETHTASTKENITLTILSAIDLRISTTQSFTNCRINGGLGRLRKIFSHGQYRLYKFLIKPLISYKFIAKIK